MSEGETIYILNLIEELNDSTLSYFDSANIKLISREECEDYEQLSYILVESDIDGANAFNDYSAGENRIDIICIGDVHNMKNFLMHNGKLVLNDEITIESIPKEILDNFFEKKQTLHIDQDFSEFKEKVKNVNITNHLSAGHYIDQISIDAFENGYNIVSLRSFVDHSIYYITYLKQIGLAGVPIEVDYSFDQSYFVLNMHVSVNEFVAEYLFDSFGGPNSENPVHYLMTIINGTCDFLELIYIDDSSKLAIRGIWSRLPNKIKGISFNNILSAKQIKEQINSNFEEYKELKDVESTQNEKIGELESEDIPGGFIAFFEGNDEEGLISSDPVEALNVVAIISKKFEEDNEGKMLSEITQDDVEIILGGLDEELNSKITEKDKKKIKEQVQKVSSSEVIAEKIQKVIGKVEEDDDFKKNLSDKLAEDIAQKVSGKFDEDSINKVLGSKEDEDENSLVKGSKEAADNFQAIVSGEADKENGDFIAKFSSGLNDEIKNSNFSGAAKNQGTQFRNLISSTMSNLEKDEKMNPHFKQFVSNEIAEKYAKKLEDFAQEKGVEVKDIASEEINDFNEKKIPELLQTILEDQKEIEKFKNKIEKGEVQENQDAKINKKLKKLLKQKMLEISELRSSGQSPNVQEAIKDVIKEEVKKEMTQGSDTNKETQIINSISEILPSKEDIEDVSKDITESFKESDNEKKKKIKELIKGKTDEGDDKSTYEKSVLVNKLKEASVFNKELKDKLKGLELQIASLQKSEEQFKEAKEKINKEVEKKLNEINAQINDANLLSIDEKEKLLKELQDGSISNEDSEKLANSIKKESELIEKAKEANSIIKKMNIEIDQKEALFKSELLKAQKVVKAKDLVVDKAKSTMRMMVEKNGKVKKALNNKIIDLNQKLADDKSSIIKEKLQKAISKVKELEEDNTNLKLKIEKIEKGAKASISKVESKLTSENKHELDKLKNKIKNIASKGEKEKQKLQKQYEQAKKTEETLREKTTVLVTKLKDFEKEISVLKNENSKSQEQDSSSSKDVEKLELELKESNKQLETIKKKAKEVAEKLKETEAKLVAASKGGSSAKEKKLEKDVGRIRVELNKAQKAAGDQRKELLKVKGENTALKNKIKTLQKGKKVA